MAALTQKLYASNPIRYLKSLAWILSTRVLSLLISLVSTFYIARTLGPQNFGELNYAVSLVNLLGFFAAIASSTVITRDLVRQPEKRDLILGTAWGLSFIGVVTTSVLAGATALFLSHSGLTVLVVGILCVAQLFSPLQVIQSDFVARSETKYISLSVLFVHITISLSKIIAMTLNQGVLVLAAIMLVEQILMASLMVFLYSRTNHTTITNWKIDFSYAKKLALDSFPFVIIMMSIVVTGRIDQVFLKHYMDTFTVGLYSVAVQLTELWQVLPQMLLVTLFPALVNAHLTRHVFINRAFALGAVLFLYSTFATVFTYIFATFVVNFIYGSAFIASVPLVKIYSLSLFGTVAGFYITHLLIAGNQRWSQILIGLIPMLTNIALNMLWIPSHGAAGAAWATVVSYSLTPLIPLSIWAISKMGHLKNRD